MIMPEARIAPPPAARQASRLAFDAYGLEVTAQVLPGEYDDNFQLFAPDSRVFVLKIMHPAREESFVDMQCRALSHLAERVPHLTLPRVVPNLRGELFARQKLGESNERLVWLLTFVPGTTLAEVKPHSLELLASLGRFLAEIDRALLDFTHPGALRELKWDLSLAAWAREYLSFVSDPKRRALAARFLDAASVTDFRRLRRSVIYGDANDHNVLASPAWPQPRKVVSVIDFGDMHFGLTVAEPAIAAAYALLTDEQPLRAAAAVLAAYHEVFPLNEAEIAAFFPLTCARLAVSVVNSAHRQSLVPNDPYVTVTEGAAWAALERLAKIHPRLAHYVLRSACGLSAVPQSGAVQNWLAQKAGSAAPLIPQSLGQDNCLVLDLSVSGTLLGAESAAASESSLTRRLREVLDQTKSRIAVGRYNEVRPLYSAPQFYFSGNPTDERRTVHLGIDLFVEPGTVISAPFEATVHALADNAQPFDYGPIVILKHQGGGDTEFFTLYGHLSRESLASLRVGQGLRSGQGFASVGTAAENGGWTPHLHFQIIVDLLDLSTNFPGVAYVSQREVFTSLSPDPNLILGIPPRSFPAVEPDLAATLNARHELLGKNLSISYAKPLKIVRGWKQFLYDDSGRAYLDVYNNVPLVGHSHPRVVEAVQRQIALLNTNTRYLHDKVLHYAKRLTELLPSPLKVCYFLNSGTEANELALRLARTHTGREDVIVLEHAYHGHTATTIDVSPYKFNGPGGRGRKPWVHVAPIPDDYRGIYRRGEADLGAKYAACVGEILDALKRAGQGIAAYLAETMPSVAGQIVFPPGYLAEVYKDVRAAGGVCIADEVQVGFGRLGKHFWGFETQGVVPDIVVLGKPIGNGFPLAAVVTAPEIAASFDNGMEFFSTFGGNPVACAAGLAVLDVLRDEALQQNAWQVGAAWIHELRGLQSNYPVVGDVRGLGLFLGIDLVNEHRTRTPASDQASYIVNRLRESGILAGTDGPHDNVIKLRPSLCFSDQDARLFTSTLASILGEDPSQPFEADRKRR
jgi:4-aminobutyrate aminotransferase-like enzyme/Ser/Thr protein kinase RdoA (MazF antagonist)